MVGSQRLLGQPLRALVTQTVLGIILGGGAGSRLYPLTKKRAKPAVPLGANYRLIDIPVSNCINSNVNKIYCLTQVCQLPALKSVWGVGTVPLCRRHVILFLFLFNLMTCASKAGQVPALSHMSRVCLVGNHKVGGKRVNNGAVVCA